MSKRFQINKTTGFDIIVNILLPLTAGLLFYLFVNRETHLSVLFTSGIEIKITGIVGTFLKSFFCDMLWSYALTFALYYVLFPFKNRIVISAIISMLSGTVLELFQLFGVVSGTFDILDILFELAAILLAVGLIKRRG